MPKDILEIFKDLGFKRYEDLPEDERKEIAEEPWKNTIEDPYQRLWRKLETGRWDWVTV